MYIYIYIYMYIYQPTLLALAGVVEFSRFFLFCVCGPSCGCSTSAYFEREKKKRI